MRTCIIYESDSGCAKQDAIHLAKNNFHVVLASSQNDKAGVNEIKKISGNSSVEWRSLDLSFPESVRDFTRWFIEKFRYLSLIIYTEIQSENVLKEFKNTNGNIDKQWRQTNRGIVTLNDLLSELLKFDQLENKLFILKKEHSAPGSRHQKSTAYSYDLDVVKELDRISYQNNFGGF